MHRRAAPAAGGFLGDEQIPEGSESGGAEEQRDVDVRGREAPVDEGELLGGLIDLRDTARAGRLSPKGLAEMVLVLLGAAAVLWLINKLWDFLIVLLVSLFASFALEPAVNFLANRGWKRGLATTVVFIGAFLIAGFFIASIVPVLVSQIAALVRNVPRYIESLNTAADRLPGQFQFAPGSSVEGQTTQLSDTVREWVMGRASNVVGVGASALGVFFKLLMAGFFTFYMVADGPKMRRALCSLLPPSRQHQLLNVWEVSIARTGGFIYSKLLLGAISAAATGIFLAVMGVPYPVALGLWFGVVSQFIPIVGTYLAAVIPLFVALLYKPVVALWVLIFILVYQQLENYFLSPRISAKTMDLHPAIAFGSAIIGGYLLGPVGAILAMPVAAIIQSVAVEWVPRSEVVDSRLVGGGEGGDAVLRRSGTRVRAGPGDRVEVEMDAEVELDETTESRGARREKSLIKRLKVREWRGKDRGSAGD